MRHAMYSEAMFHPPDGPLNKMSSLLSNSNICKSFHQSNLLLDTRCSASTNSAEHHLVDESKQFRGWSRSKIWGIYELENFSRNLVCRKSIVSRYLSFGIWSHLTEFSTPLDRLWNNRYWIFKRRDTGKSSNKKHRKIFIPVNNHSNSVISAQNE